MKHWSFRKKFVVGIVLLFAAVFIYRTSTSYINDEDNRITRNEILHLEINGVILNGNKFLGQLKKYRKDDSVKAIVIEINSPGGAVGPSQEIYHEIMTTKLETKKPVVCVSTSLIASGGYYAALACDKIIVAPGTMIGSIGVIMEFANLERLYDWAKVQRYTITSGKFKDSGSEYRPMREDERKLFQDMIDEVYAQFKGTVVAARKLPEATVAAYADGRVMTGAKAVELKFADEVGYYGDAVKLAAKMAKLKDEDYKIYKPKRDKFHFMDVFSLDDDEDDLNSVVKNLKQGSVKVIAKEFAQTVLKTKYLNQPLMLMPGYWE